MSKLEYRYALEVSPAAIDENGHVNNVAYVRWMQEAAVAHSEAVGGIAATRECGGMWVVRKHEIEYRGQAFLGDKLEVRTWIADCRHVSSRRKYEFVRPSDGAVLARGQTDWVLLDAATFAPKAIPEELRKLYAGEEGEG